MTCPATDAAADGISLVRTRRFTKPQYPWTNGKVERFNRTLLTEWAYARAWTSDNARPGPWTSS
jgi:transposase InsO family protein